MIAESKTTWGVNVHKILTRSEIARVLIELQRKAKRSRFTFCNLAIFRLATCVGLRVSEIAGLRLQDVRTHLQRPYVEVPAVIAKFHRGRKVPLWWDGATLRDLEAWKCWRIDNGAKEGDYFVCSLYADIYGRKLERDNLRHRFIRACSILGPERCDRLTIHHGRHSFVTHSINGGKKLHDVRDAAGHANIATTSIYIHVGDDDDNTVGNLFEFTEGGKRCEPESILTGLA